MDDFTWNYELPASSKRIFDSENCVGFDEAEEEEEGYFAEGKREFPCPFCFQVFDIVDLCCHIDELHPVEANTSKLKLVKGEVSSNLSSSRKGSLDQSLQFFLSGSHVSPSLNMEPDPLLSTFIRNTSATPEVEAMHHDISMQETPLETISDENVQKKEMVCESIEEKNESRAEFVQKLVMSTILEDLLL